MNDYQQTTLWLGALRYYIGRRTAGVSDFTRLLIEKWPTLPVETQNFVKRDLEEAFTRDDRTRASFAAIALDPTVQWDGPSRCALGDDCDRAEWEKVRRLWSEDKI